MILAVHTSQRNPSGLVPDLLRVLRSHLRRRRRAAAEPSTEDALVRALCHDMRGSLACLETALGRLHGGSGGRLELLSLAQAQAAHLTSMLRTADATGGAPSHPGARRLGDVVAASVAASGLPRTQLTLALDEEAAGVTVGDARLQRILVNLLENAHRHGGGAPVRLAVSRRAGWVTLALTQDGVPAARVVGHLCTDRPPVDLTGLGLWSVQRQARELGGRIVWADDGTALTLTVELPDR
ncbi:sensor histidine kinase [Geodermatophilus sp. YIM 151500]|uniref:sensor histidine kinase n=1 Tax=Geodermatophilus sp. YIM 151500 TaxID=2984531 RepID=UPI0021E3DA24|nr:ATP-binding protein [Geodermatophilus sp. YIM 151500]MCV2490540.1 sensor histidine kinase [Geodermatophilus sp. YIM 151500]